MAMAVTYIPIQSPIAPTTSARGLKSGSTVGPKKRRRHSSVVMGRSRIPMEQIVHSAAGTDPLLQFLAEARFKMWGTKGLRRYDGTAKPALMSRWNSARTLPIE